MDTTRFGEIRIEALPPLHVARCRAVSPTPENDAAQHMANWRAAQQLAGPFRHFGFNNDVSPEQAQQGLRGYEVWTTVSAAVRPSDDVTMGDFPGGLYAVMDVYQPFDDPFEIIPAGWERLHEWVMSDTYIRSAEHQWLEELIEGDGKTTLALFHPVVAVAAETHPV